jgi:hypothetical protein
MRRSFTVLAVIFLAMRSVPAVAWGNEGHEVVALIAQSFLDPTARKTVNAMLAADTDTLTGHSIAEAAYWADKYRDSNENGARQNTRLWHFVDIELDGPNLKQACYGHLPLPAGTLASNGPPRDCVIAKIDQFTAELAGARTDPLERIVALKFILHFVGDVHQPLHTADDHDRGGNDKRVSAAGFRGGKLHHFWDTEFVNELGPNPKQIAARLVARISAADASAWAGGGPADWAKESFQVAKNHVYGQLPRPNARGSYRLPPEYIAMATEDVSAQLSKAGVRLAAVLNRTLGEGN